MNLLASAADFLFAVFLVLSGMRLARSGRIALRAALMRCAAALAAYWVMFVPALFVLRRLGLSDIGRMTILREAFFLGDSVIPFSGQIGGYVLSLLLLAALTAIPHVHPAFSLWLYAVMPLTAAQAIAFYAPAHPHMVHALRNLQTAVCCMGAGCALARCGLRVRSRSARAALGAAAVAGHMLLPLAEPGALQLIGNRISFPIDADMLWAPMLILAAAGRLPASGHPDRGEAAVGMIVSAPYFDRGVTAMIKGAALVMMFVHHFFTLPSWYVEGISYPGLSGFAEMMQLPLAVCVPLYAFITGYAYHFAKEKTLRSSLRRIAGVMIVYWMIQSLLFAAAALTGGEISLPLFLWEAAGLESRVALFNWYIAFYWMAMLMLPLLTRFPHRTPLGASLLLCGLPVLAATAVRALCPQAPHAMTAAQDMLDGVTGLCAGYVTARFALFERVGDRVTGRRRAVRLPVCAALGAAAFFGRRYAPRLVIPLPGLGEAWALRVSMDIVYAPVIIYALANLLPLLPGLLRAVLAELGRYSLHMWLISCVFFGVSKAVFQPLLYLPRQPLLVTLWGLLLCWGAARIIDRPAKAIIRRLRI